MNLAEVERQKYEDIWAYDEYKNDESQSSKYIDAFFELLEPLSGQKVIDIGCGQGNGGIELKNRHLRVWWLDLTESGLLPEVDRKNFIQTPLWGNWHRHMGWEYGYCCDVMEHIPTEYVMLSAANILKNCRKTFFTICNTTDNYGPRLLGSPLHLTVRSFQWWLGAFEEIGEVHDARDMCGQSLFVVSA